LYVFSHSVERPIIFMKPLGSYTRVRGDDISNVVETSDLIISLVFLSLGHTDAIAISWCSKRENKMLNAEQKFAVYKFSFPHL